MEFLPFQAVKQALAATDDYPFDFRREHISVAWAFARYETRSPPVHSVPIANMMIKK